MIRVILLLLCLTLPAQAQRQMVVAAHPMAAETGLAMLRAGGSAIDAAIAAQAMLTLVEPQSSGLGGGALLLHWDAVARRLDAWDGRETAPAAASPGLFLKDGQPMAFHEAAVGGRAVGVPGAMRMLEAVHRRHGKLAWASCSPRPSRRPNRASPSRRGWPRWWRRTPSGCAATRRRGRISCRTASR